MAKPILCLDFDGVIHSYASGWKGSVRNIPDDPVPGALEFIVKAVEHFDVHIFSTRSHQFGGRWAMKRWLRKQYFRLGMSLSGADEETFQNPFWKWISETAFADPWEDEVRWATRRLLKKIKFPKHKPAAFLTIDDRCFVFRGFFGSDPSIFLNFQPWNKKDV